MLWPWPFFFHFELFVLEFLVLDSHPFEFRIFIYFSLCLFAIWKKTWTKNIFNSFFSGGSSTKCCMRMAFSRFSFKNGSYLAGRPHKRILRKKNGESEFRIFIKKNFNRNLVRRCSITKNDTWIESKVMRVANSDVGWRQHADKNRKWSCHVSTSS